MPQVVPPPNPNAAPGPGRGGGGGPTSADRMKGVPELVRDTGLGQDRPERHGDGLRALPSATPATAEVAEVAVDAEAHQGQQGLGMATSAVRS